MLPPNIVSILFTITPMHKGISFEAESILIFYPMAQYAIDDSRCQEEDILDSLPLLPFVHHLILKYPDFFHKVLFCV